MTTSPYQTFTNRTAVGVINEMQDATVLSIETSLLANAITWAISIKEDCANTMRQIAAQIRAGEPMPLFAKGEDGARAADMLADQHEYDIRRLQVLVDVMWASEYVLTLTDNEVL